MDDQSSDASSVDGSADESSDASSIDGIEERAHKRLKLQEKIEEDRISALPDSLIQHILSFLPSTKEAIQTGILSKRWLNQWARVPVLIFKSNETRITFERKYAVNFVRFISNTLLLYDRFSKIRKFHIYYNFDMDINFTSKLRFATSRGVEELILYNKPSSETEPDPYMLPKFIFDNACLLKLQIDNCYLDLTWRVNWPSLKTLTLDGNSLKDSQSIENVLSGSPSLESFEIYALYCDTAFVIASKSLKTLILLELDVDVDFETSCANLEISCPNLEELRVQTCEPNFHSIFPAKTLQHVLSTSPLLHSLELKDCFFHQLVIASKSLKKLVLYKCCAFKISCPNLEVLNLCGSNIKTCKSILLPPSSAILDFVPSSEGRGKKFGMEILEELKPVKELKVQNWIVKILPALEMRGLSYPLLNLKYLTLDCPNFKHISGILYVLHCSPALESLVIKLHNHKYRKTADLDLNNFKETFWNSNETAFTCLVSHLKTVKVTGLSKRDGKCKVILQFVEFLLKNARVLEKMVVILEDGGLNFLGRVSRKLLSFSRCSPHAILELL